MSRDGMNRTVDTLVIGSMVMTLAGVIIGAFLKEPHAFGITAILIVVLLSVAWKYTESSVLGWLLLSGLTAGILELWADWVHVEYFQSLVYTDYFGFKLLASPFYMPIGWCALVVQFGYLALRMAGKWPPWKAILFITILGMSLPPWYEEFAATARAWYYPPAGFMVSNTPLWIILTYGGCTFTIAVITLHLYQRKSPGKAAFAGFLTASGFMFSSVFWYALLGT